MSTDRSLPPLASISEFNKVHGVKAHVTWITRSRRSPRHHVSTDAMFRPIMSQRVVRVIRCLPMTGVFVSLWGQTELYLNAEQIWFSQTVMETVELTISANWSTSSVEIWRHHRGWTSVTTASRCVLSVSVLPSHLFTSSSFHSSSILQAARVGGWICFSHKLTQWNISNHQS